MKKLTGYHGEIQFLVTVQIIDKAMHIVLFLKYAGSS